VNDANGQHWGQFGRSYPKKLGDSTAPPQPGDFLGLSWEDRYRLSTPALFNSYFDLGIRQVTTSAAVGSYHYHCVRNNNFSNRSQKGLLVVRPTPAGEQYVEPDYTFGSVLEIPGFARVRFSFDPRQTGQQEIRIEDAGPSPYATHFVRIVPTFLAMPDKGYLQLRMYHPWYPFTYGRIYWSASPNGESVEVQTAPGLMPEGGYGLARANIYQGGYYVVKTVVNGSAVGGVLIAVIVLTVGIYYVRKRFGCRVFNKTKQGEAHEGLIAASAAPSDAVATPVSSPIPAATDTATTF